MSLNLIQSIEDWFHSHEDGEFGVQPASCASMRVGQSSDATTIIYSTKQYCLPRITDVVDPQQAVAKIARYGLPIHDDLPFIHGSSPAVNRVFIGDADPPDILVYSWLREHLPECQVMDERGLTELLAYAAEWNPQNRQAPRPRPDFAVRSKARPVVLLDAKYRDLWARPLPRDMLYQLAMYATSGAGDPLAVILHPTEDGIAQEARIDIRDVITGAVRGGVALRPVPLHRLATLVREGTHEARCAEATRLAFGD